MGLANEEIVISVAYLSTAHTRCSLFKGSQGGSVGRLPTQALANKTARVAWAVMSRQNNYRRIVVAA